jgi:HEPN domain-containing protein
MNDQVEQWWKFATEDLHVAGILLNEDIYTQVCFHCQQCVEKVFKSVLVHLGIPVVRTHSIVTLSKLLPVDLISTIQGDVSIFDDFYIPVRYPDTLPGGLPDGPPGKQEAEEVLAQAIDIFQTVKSYLTSHPSLTK